MFRLGSVNARVGLIFFSDKCYFFVFAVEVACWFKKKSQTNTFVSILFLFWFFEIGKIWTVNREYSGLSKGKKIIRQKKKVLNFSLLQRNQNFSSDDFFYMLNIGSWILCVCGFLPELREGGTPVDFKPFPQNQS